MKNKKSCLNKGETSKLVQPVNISDITPNTLKQLHFILWKNRAQNEAELVLRS